MVESSRMKVDLQKKEHLKEIIKRRHHLPLFLYSLEEKAVNTVRCPCFVDSLLVLLAFIAACLALHFYPLPIIIAIAAVLFIATIKKPFLGMILLMIAVLPMLIYQMPALAWIYVIVMAAALIYGHMYYRTILLIYAIVAFMFCPIGYFAVIPTFIIGTLVVGYKRAWTMAVLLVVAAVSLSAVSGVQNTGYIIYNAAYAHSQVVGASLAPYVVPSKPGLTMATFAAGVKFSFSTLDSSHVVGATTGAANAVVASFLITPQYYIAQLIVLMLLVFAIDSFSSSSRMKYKGTLASVIGIGYPLSAVVLSIPSMTILPYLAMAISFLIAPAMLYVLEFFNIKVVNTLDMRKQDLRMKFGEAFENLEGGNAQETFDDIANYESTKKELVDAVLSPIEEPGISKAYNVKPAKGILFFGPPGTGKTVMMRALSNEIRAGFYYVNAANLVSGFPGETERIIANIFNVAKKNAPCVLFFDEVDSIATSRQKAAAGSASAQALSQLLIEMDGFQQIQGVIVVGATNAPDLLDPAILRPGRFDKIVYLPPPDHVARKKIFDLYLKNLPVADDIDLDEISENTERYTGADVKAVCESVAQKIAQEASSKHKVLEITQDDIIDRIKSTKPSVSLSQIELYQKFRLDFERSVYGQVGDEGIQEVSMDDVVGLDDAKKIIYDAIVVPLVHPELVRKYDIKNINGVLLFGPPGTGKTMLIRAIKSEMRGITMLELNGAEIANQGVEKAASTIKEIFDRAKENAPAIILLDEVDELLLKRGSASEYSAQITSEMLRQIDGIGGRANIVVVGTTNRPEVIDSAALRPGRFDKLVYAKPPNRAQRSMLFKLNLRGVPVSAGINFEQLGVETSGFTGADIYHVCREAKTIALDQNIKSGEEAKITEDDIRDIISKTRGSAPESVVSQYLSFFTKYGER